MKEHLVPVVMEDYCVDCPTMSIRTDSVYSDNKKTYSVHYCENLEFCRTVRKQWETQQSAECEKAVGNAAKCGMWVRVGDDTWKCSECGEISCCAANYCPDCGADMRGAVDE